METQFDFFPNQSALKAELRKFSRSGQKTKLQILNGYPYFINEFWTAKQRQANRIHEISYRACFKAQFPAFFIERLSQHGDIVYDPFMGRGTTAIEAALRGRIPYGNDINPLSRALTEPRINPPSLDQVIHRLACIPWKSFKHIKNKKLLVFYHPNTLQQIEALRSYFIKKDKLDSVDSWISYDCFESSHGSFSRFFLCFHSSSQSSCFHRRTKENQ